MSAALSTTTKRRAASDAPAAESEAADAGRGGRPARLITPRARVGGGDEREKVRRGRPRKPVDPGFPRYRVARVDTLVPYANNARTHSPAQVRKIAASIREFGFTNPVLVDGKRGIVAGHGRVLAAQLLEMETVPVIELAHLTAAQRRAYVLADNKLALDAGWDEELLALELGELRDGGFDLALTGFGEGELAGLFGEQDLAGTEPAPRAETTTSTTTLCPSCGHSFAV